MSVQEHREVALRSLIENRLMPGFGFLGSLFGIATFVFPNYGNTKVELWILLTAVFLGTWIVFALLVELTKRDELISSFSTETNLKLDLSPLHFLQRESVLALKRTVNIEVGTLVTVMRVLGSIEVPMALGRVSTVQQKLIQIKLDVSSVDDEVLAYLSSENNLRQTIVRPFVRYEDLFPGRGSV